MDEPKPKATDVVLLHSPTADGEGIRVIRARDGRIEAGEVRPLAEGKPVHGEIVKLTPRSDVPALCDVDVTYAPPKAETASEGRGHPAQVANDAYRTSWERIFGEGNLLADEESPPSSRGVLN